MALSEAVSVGRRHGLVALRDRLAAEIDQCESARDVAALSLRLMDVLEQIDSLEDASIVKPSTALDEIAARRAKRVKRAAQ